MFLSKLLPILFFSSTSLAGSYGYIGVGMSLKRTKSAWMISATVKRGPADKADIKKGEWLYAIEGKAVADLKKSRLKKLLDGKAGSLVTLTIQDSEKTSKRDIRLERKLLVAECFLDGQFRLQIWGSLERGYLIGFIGDHRIELNVRSALVHGTIRKELVSLRIELLGGNRMAVSGMIRSKYIRWSGGGGLFTGFQKCIR